MIDKLNFTAKGGFEMFVENTCRFDSTQIFYAFRFSVHLYELLQARGVLDVPAKLHLEINLKTFRLFFVPLTTKILESNFQIF